MLKQDFHRHLRWCWRSYFKAQMLGMDQRTLLKRTRHFTYFELKHVIKRRLGSVTSEHNTPDVTGAFVGGASVWILIRRNGAFPHMLCFFVRVASSDNKLHRDRRAQPNTGSLFEQQIRGDQCPRLKSSVWGQVHTPCVFNQLRPWL